MKKIMRPAAALLILVLLAGTLSGCRFTERKELREKAEKYVKELQRKTGSDTLTLSSDKVKFSDKTLSVPFSVYSETYKASFTVWVPREGTGFSQPTDNYYSLWLKAEAEEKVKALAAEVLGLEKADVSVDFRKVEHEALSGLAGGSLEELLQIASEKAGLGGILIVRLKNAGQVNPDTEQVDGLLAALQEKGYYGVLYPYASDAVWFEVLKDGFWKTTQTGADSGAYLQREEYTPTASR